MEIKHGYATLNDEKRISLKRLLVVPKTSKTIRYGNRAEEEKEGIGAKRVIREGIEPNFSFKKRRSSRHNPLRRSIRISTHKKNN